LTAIHIMIQESLDCTYICSLLLPCSYLAHIHGGGRAIAGRGKFGIKWIDGCTRTWVGMQNIVDVVVIKGWVEILQPVGQIVQGFDIGWNEICALVCICLLICKKEDFHIQKEGMMNYCLR